MISNASSSRTKTLPSGKFRPKIHGDFEKHKLSFQRSSQKQNNVGPNSTLPSNNRSILCRNDFCETTGISSVIKSNVACNSNNIKHKQNQSKSTPKGYKTIKLGHTSKLKYTIPKLKSSCSERADDNNPTSLVHTTQTNKVECHKPRTMGLKRSTRSYKPYGKKEISPVKGHEKEHCVINCDGLKSFDYSSEYHFQSTIASADNEDVNSLKCKHIPNFQEKSGVTVTNMTVPRRDIELMESLDNKDIGNSYYCYIYYFVCG